MIGELNGNVPAGPIEDRWSQHKFDMKLVAPNNRRKFEVIIVGTGLAGASAAATLGEQGYRVKVFTYHDSPRRAHSIAAQGGINAAKNYKGDGDSIFRLFYDTVKGGDFRSRESNVYRLAEVSVDIIDQCVAQGVPFAREYGGLLDNRSFGGAQVSRTFYARGQTGQQLLLGAYQALMQQVSLGRVELHTKTELLDVVTKDGVVVGAVPATQTSLTLPCMPGRYCVQCVLPDGTLSAPKCCEVTAADCGGKPNIVRGDCDGDGNACTSVNDAVLNLNFNFLGGRPPPCLAAAGAGVPAEGRRSSRHVAAADRQGRRIPARVWRDHPTARYKLERLCLVIPLSLWLRIPEYK